ncbi:hypothetical protein ACQ4M4_05040 [Leptolyngbya sp. AN02str]|uniref:hypothetical protein n=1 Tax=Leptolyngbya sp. AN02str TaxID=3423363 RepID=UPI003D313348
MTVKFVTHTLNTGDITVMGQVSNVATVQGSKISRIGAVEGHEQENPAAIHVNFQISNNPEDLLVWMLGLADAIEIGLHLVAMGIEDQPSPHIEEVRDRLSQLVSELDRSLQVFH